MTATPPTETPADHGRELKRGAFANAIAMLASNFRGIFTFLVARLLGPAVLGTFSVAWATTDLLTKLGMFALDTTITTFIARSERTGDRARSRALFRLAVAMAVGQCIVVAICAIAVLRLFGPRLGIDPQINTAISLMLCAMPGVALYRINIAVSRGMKVMSHDIYSRGLTETVGTTAAFLLALYFGAKTFAPQIGAVLGTAASGIVALLLAASLFRRAPQPAVSWTREREARALLTFAAPIAGYDLLNALIVRLDVILLAAFIGRAPGVSLAVVGIYGAVVEVAGGLRKVNQIFNPIFAPIIAGLTAHGEQERGARAFAQVAQWMLWTLLPIIAVMSLAGPLILSIYGPAFRQGSLWLIIVALACGTNAFVGLAETVITVQKPHLNLWNSIICCVVAIVGNIFLIRHFGALGAAFGILLPYVVFGFLRHRTLRVGFKWAHPWKGVHPPLLAALAAGVPALVIRIFFAGIPGELAAAVVFLAIYFIAWRRHRARTAEMSFD